MTGIHWRDAAVVILVWVLALVALAAWRVGSVELRLWLQRRRARRAADFTRHAEQGTGGGGQPGPSPVVAVAARPPRPRVLRVRVSLDEHAAQALAVVAEPPARFRCLVCWPPAAVDDPRTHSRLHHGPRAGPEDDPQVMAVIAEQARRIGGGQ